MAFFKVWLSRRNFNHEGNIVSYCMILYFFSLVKKYWAPSSGVVFSVKWNIRIDFGWRKLICGFPWWLSPQPFSFIYSIANSQQLEIHIRPIVMNPSHFIPPCSTTRNSFATMHNHATTSSSTRVMSSFPRGKANRQWGWTECICFIFLYFFWEMWTLEFWEVSSSNSMAHIYGPHQRGSR